MDFKQSVETVVLKKYMMLDGRASRSEYWWFALAYFILAVIAGVLDGALGTPGIIGMIVGLGLLIPTITVSVRRFHDINKPGWWVLIFFIPIVGLIAWLYFFTKKGDPGSNTFGPAPAS